MWQISFKLQFLLIFVAVTVGIFCTNTPSKLKVYIYKFLDLKELNGTAESSNREKIFTKFELAKYNGDDGSPIYLAILGSVYDVTKSRKHYGIGCSYNFFVGRDASVSFITGEFNSYDEQTADDVNSLKPSELLSLVNWKTFYDKEYARIGKLAGRFYYENGTQTEYFHNFSMIVHHAKLAKIEDQKIRQIYPDCNIEWSAESDTKVWCTNMSGGIAREWSGYPRKIFEIGKDTFRCACIPHVETIDANLMLKLYDNCDPLSDTCYYKVD